MNKSVQTVWIAGLSCLFSLVFGETVLAKNQLTEMAIEVELQKDGSGVITEHREMSMDDGTELYITLDELQDSELIDFSVTGYEEVENWDSDASREEKAGKYGVLETDDGLELVWGIGEYGENTYEVTYSLSNLVRELEDGQALFWDFDTFSGIPAESLTVEITGPEPFTEENTRLWGFGFDGDMQLNDGRVVWRAQEEVDSSNDVTVLLQFPEAFFNTQVHVDMTLEEQRERALDGSSYNEGGLSELGIIPILILSGIAVAGAGTAAGATMYAMKVNKAKKAAGEMRLDSSRTAKNQGILYDELPYKGNDLAVIAFLLLKVIKGKGYFEDYFSAYLLKWAHEGRIRIETTGQKKQFDEDYETILELVDYEEERRKDARSFAGFLEEIPLKGSDTYETGLWLMLLESSDTTGLVREKQMKRWAKKHAKEVQDYANYLTDYSKDKLEAGGYITFKEIEVWGRRQEVAAGTAKGEELLDRLIQFDNYLEEAELRGFNAETSKLTLEEYLVWSVLFFKKEAITEQFKDMLEDPPADYAQGQFVYYYWYWYGMSGFRESWTSGLASGGFHSRDSAVSSSGAAGMGGSTSFGGGFGAGGGGGGGAR